MSPTLVLSIKKQKAPAKYNRGFNSKLKRTDEN